MKGKAQKKDCPICGNPLDIDTYIPGQASQEPAEIISGDVTFCFKCRTVLVINEALNIVMPEEDVLDKIIHDHDFHNFINQIDQAQKNKIHLN